MSSKWGWATIVALCFVNTLVQAQQPGGGGRGGAGRGGRFGLMSLLSNEAVQKELAVSEEQIEKLKKIADAFGTEVREQLSAGGGGGGFSPEVIAKMQEVGRNLTAKHLPAVKETLKAEQFTRLQQITWQQAGATAFADAELAKQLDLKPDQQDKIKAVISDYAAKQGGLLAGGFNPENFAKMRELNQERDGKAIEVLTKEQQAKFTELKGKKFDMPQGGGPGGDRPARPKSEDK